MPTSIFALALALCYGVCGLSLPHALANAPSLEAHTVNIRALPPAIGMLSVTPPLTLYAQPSPTAPVVERLNWSFETQQASEAVVESEAASQLFRAPGFFEAYSARHRIALLPVLNEQRGWYQVKLPHLSGHSAWLPPSQAVNKNVYQPEAFLTWPQFMFLYGKRFGFHWLEGVSPRQKSVHLRPEDDAPLAKVTFVQGIRVLHVRGNWMLVELRDIGEERPIGWLRWRSDEGAILVWPNFNGERPLYQAPSNPMNVEGMIDAF